MSVNVTKKEANIAKALNELSNFNLIESVTRDKWTDLIEDYFLDDAVLESDDDCDDDIDGEDQDVFPPLLDADIDDELCCNEFTESSIQLSVSVNEEELQETSTSCSADVSVDEISAVMQQIDTVDENEDDEINKINTFVCECVKRRSATSKFGKESCSSRLTAQYMYRCRLDMSALTSDEKDLVIIGKISCMANYSIQTERPRQKCQTKRHHQKTFYLVEGKRICRSTFRFLHMISQTTLDACFKHYKDNGISARIKKRGGRHANNRQNLSYEDIKKVVTFVTNFAEEHAIILPGRHPGQKRFDVKLLPSHVTKASVHRLYAQEMERQGLRAAKESTFRKLWISLTPHITRTKPMSDLCWECQKNNYAVYRSANLPDIVKSAKLKKQEKHLLTVTKARSFYNNMITESKNVIKHLGLRLGKTDPMTRDIDMHYSFDYAQQMHYPADPHQPGPIYFLTPRKCGLFGVCCEEIPQQVNYLIDEGMSSSKGSSSVINYVNHFFNNFGLGETRVHLHCDNCSGQNKNRFMLNYLVWRTLHRLHQTISLNFLITGHTKFAPDWCFGLVKQRYRRTKVSCLDEIVDMVESSTVTGVNLAQLIGREDGTVFVHSVDFNTWLDPYFKPFPGIKSYQHFRISAENPGMVTAREFCDSETETTFQLLRDANNLPPLHCPYKLKPPGLDGRRQKYLYDSIREFCDEHCRDICCPKPTKEACK